MRISDYSEPLDRRRQEICQLSPADPQRAKLTWQFFKEGDRLIQTAKAQNPDLDELDQHLKQLMDQARQLDTKKPREKLLQREILNQCLTSLQSSKKLWRDFQQGITHQEAYSNALVQMYEFFMKNHANYDPAKSKVMTWLNYRLKKDWITHITKQNKQQKRETNFEENIDTPSNIDHKIQIDLIYQGVCQWIDTEPDLKTPITKTTKITIDYLLRQRFLLEKSWKIIAQETGKNVPTLSAWYERYCRPILMDFIKNNYDTDHLS